MSKATKRNGNHWASILPDNFNMTLLAKPKVSPTGKWVFFLGTHYDGIHSCYDVGACAIQSPGKPTTRRHHHNKEEALVTWSQTLERLTEIENTPEESDDRERLIIVKPN
jgi:hypothetical protein